MITTLLLMMILAVPLLLLGIIIVVPAFGIFGLIDLVVIGGGLYLLIKWLFNTLRH